MTEISRRAVLGSAVAGAAASALPAVDTPAAAAPAPAAPVAADDRPIGWLDDRVPWADFLGAADLIWKRPPATWYEGPFLGNGFLGSGVYAAAGTNAVRFNVQHSQVQDHRPEYGALFGLARLPIGYLTLEPVGTITAVDWRLDLWNAELRGTVTTTAGVLKLRAFVHTNRSILMVDVTATDGEHDFRWVFHPAVAVSPRADPVWKKPPPTGYVPNPAPIVVRREDTEIITQPMLSGGEHATAWREVRRGLTRTLYATVAWSHPDKRATERAYRNVLWSSAIPGYVFQIDHREWWHDYYRKSFLSIPDARLQSFYWIQLYKVASAARREAPPMATSGPWLEPTPWPATWWNLNVQLEYWLIHGSNHLELDAVTRAIDEYRQNLIDQVPAPYQYDSAGIPRTSDMTLFNGPAAGTAGFPVGIPGQDPPTPEVGDLTWALHNVWLSYRHTMDEQILRNVVYPLLKRTINYYRHFLFVGPDGRLHLPPTFSPEYGVDAPDTNYDLALIRWGCTTLLDAVRILRVDDALAPVWRDILAKLVDYPVDENGFMIGAGVPFAKSHRHYSHMLMVYPLYLLTWEQPQFRDLIETSLNHWISFQGALQGYSYTGAASISAQLGRGDDAAFYLGELLRLYVQANTMYKESGPVIETPLSAAQSLHDMLCQSWGDVIRVFPAVPAAWADVTLHDFRTQGAFLLSAVRAGGATRWIRVYSEAGAPLTLRTGITGPLTVRDRHGHEPHWRQLPNGDVEIDLRRGQEVLVYPRGSRPDLTIAPVTPNAPAPPWGLP
jgi:alpha-L-fucosidase 2